MQGLGSAPTLDDDDEILLRIDSELEQAAGQPVETSLGDLEKIFSESELKKKKGKNSRLSLIKKMKQNTYSSWTQLSFYI